MTTKLKFVTAEELLRMPREGGVRYELIRGVLVPKMPTGDPHGEAVTMTSYALTGYVVANDYGSIRSGEPGYRLERDPDTVRAPDVAWFAPGTPPGGNSRISGACARPGRRDQVIQQLQPGDGRQGYHVAQLRVATGVGGGPGADHHHRVPPRRASGNSGRG